MLINYILLVQIIRLKHLNGNEISQLIMFSFDQCKLMTYFKIIIASDEALCGWSTGFCNNENKIIMIYSLKRMEINDSYLPCFKLKKNLNKYDIVLILTLTFINVSNIMNVNEKTHKF